MPKIKIKSNATGKEQEFDITPGSPDAQKIAQLAQSGKISVLSYSKEPDLNLPDLPKPPNAIEQGGGAIGPSNFGNPITAGPTPEQANAQQILQGAAAGGIGAGPFGAIMGAAFPPQNATQAASMALTPQIASKTSQAIQALKGAQGPIKQALLQFLTQGGLASGTDMAEKALQGQNQNPTESLIRGGLTGLMAGGASGVQSMYNASPAVNEAKVVGKLDKSGGINPRGKTSVEPWNLEEKLTELPGAKRVTPPTQGPANLQEASLSTNYEIWKQALKAKDSKDLFDKVLQKDPHEISSFIDSFDTNSDAVRKGLIEHLYQPGKDYGAFGKIKEMYQGNKDLLQQKLQAVYGSAKQATRATDVIDSIGKIPQARTGWEKFVDYAKHRAAYGLMIAPIALAAGGEHKTSVLLLAEMGGLLAVETPAIINAAAKSPTFGRAFKTWVDAGMPQSMVKYGTPLYQALQHLSISDQSNTEQNSEQQQ